MDRDTTLFWHGKVQGETVATWNIYYTAAGTIRTAANKKERKNRIIIHFVYHLALTTSAPPL
jgi:hypothetical protein